MCVEGKEELHGCWFRGMAISIWNISGLFQDRWIRWFAAGHRPFWCQYNVLVEWFARVFTSTNLHKWVLMLHKNLERSRSNGRTLSFAQGLANSILFHLRSPTLAAFDPLLATTREDLTCFLLFSYLLLVPYARGELLQPLQYKYTKHQSCICQFACLIH